jgi:beta-glucosidase-like glycosyl hydrolase
MVMNLKHPSADQRHPYQDPALPITARVEDLLARMTLEEKQAQLHGLWMVLAENGHHTLRGQGGFIDSDGHKDLNALLRNGLGQVTRALGTHGVAPAQGLAALNTLQRYLTQETRLGIPAMSHEECLAGLMARGATLFPCALAMGASWNPDLVEELAQAIGQEARAVGCSMGLAPVLDVSRDVRWGRTEETLGEDPYLVGVLGTRYVRGLQGPERDLLATLKHFVAHSFSEGGRNHAPVHVGNKELNDTFLLPFEMVVKLANPGGVMPAYHDIDGDPLHASRKLLTEVLREQWGFDGLVVADYGGVALLHQHHRITHDGAESIAAALNAGLDVELPGNDCAQAIPRALDKGLLHMATLDDAVRRVLKEKFATGLFEKTYADGPAPALNTPHARQLARKAAQQSVVILENQGILPLAPSAKQRIALIGPTANDPMSQLSGYSFPVHVLINGDTEGTQNVVTALEGFRRVYGADHIHYAPGCRVLSHRSTSAAVFPGDVRETDAQRPQSLIDYSTDQMDEAVQCARHADVAVVMVGDLAGLFLTGTVGEGSDTDSLALPGVQQQLVHRIIDTGTPTIVVITGGRPYTLGGLERRAAALVMAFAGGQEGGNGLVDVLSGHCEPSGRMPLSQPRSAGAVPYVYNHHYKSSGVPIALHFGSSYPFGSGLSYTHFSYTNLRPASQTLDLETGTLQFTFELANTGTRIGTEVVQVYVRDCVASVVRPHMELKAFARVSVAPGDVRQLHCSIPVDMLSFTNSSGQRVVEPGEFDVMVGASSAKLPLQTRIRVLGDAPRVLPKFWRMESSVVEVDAAPLSATAPSQRKEVTAADLP